MKNNFIIGLDIGGSKIRGVLWDGRRVRASFEFSTPRRLPEFRRKVALLAARLSRLAKNRIENIGIGAAGVINGTTVFFSPNIRYLKKFDFRAIFPLMRLRMDNDARAFARAELLLGAGRKVRSILAFTIGTGIGRAYGAKERVVRIEKLECPEKWERHYQKTRDQKDNQKLAELLGDKLSAIALRYPSDILVVGGGVMKRPGFFSKLKDELKNRGVHRIVRPSRFGGNATAVGAALLFAGR